MTITDILNDYERRKNQTLADWFAENMAEHAEFVAALEANEEKRYESNRR